MATLDVSVVEKWTVGYDHKRGFAVIVLEFHNQPTKGYAVPLPEIAKLGRALLDLNVAGTPSPARPQ